MVKINPWIIVGQLVLLGGLYGLHLWDRSVTVKREVVHTKEVMNTVYQKRILEQAAKAKLVESKLTEKAKTDEKLKQDQINSINAKLVVAVDQLRNERKRRPASVTNSPVAPIIGTCTGRELYAEDGEFLTREAARADKVAVERDYYYTQYENARKALDEAAK